MADDLLRFFLTLAIQGKSFSYALTSSTPEFKAFRKILTDMDALRNVRPAAICGIIKEGEKEMCSRLLEIIDAEQRKLQHCHEVMATQYSLVALDLELNETLRKRKLTRTEQGDKEEEAKTEQDNKEEEAKTEHDDKEEELRGTASKKRKTTHE